MELKTKEFLNEIQKVLPATKGSSNYLGENDDIIFFKDNTIYSLNGEIIISNPFKNDFDCCLPTKLLIKVLSGINSEKINVVKTEKNIVIKSDSDKHTAKINIIEKENNYFDLLPKSKNIKWEKLPEDFFEGLSKCVFSAANNKLMGGLNCILLSGDKIVSSDNYRISEYTLNDILLKDKFLLSKNTVIDLLNIKNIDFTDFAIFDNKWILFKSNNLIFSILLMHENFNDYEIVLNNFKAKHKMKLPKKDLIVALNFNSVMSDIGTAYISNEKINVTISKNDIICEAKNETGSSQSVTQYESKKKLENDISFQINPKYFIDILNYSNNLYIGEKVVLFKSKKFKHIIAIESV